MSDNFDTEDFEVTDEPEDRGIAMGPAAYISMVADMAVDGEPSQFTALLGALLTSGDWEQFKATVMADRDDIIGPMDDMDYDLSDDSTEDVKKAMLRALKVIFDDIKKM